MTKQRNITIYITSQDLGERLLDNLRLGAIFYRGF